MVKRFIHNPFIKNNVTNYLFVYILPHILNIILKAMIKSSPKQKMIGTVLSFTNIKNWLQGIIPSLKEDSINVTLLNNVKPLSMTTDKDKIPRKLKSARIANNSTEQIRTLVLQDGEMIIRITPVTAEEEANKRVRGYKYLTA